MFMTHNCCVYSEDITLIDHVTYPQYTHQVTDGGMLVAKGIKTIPMVLIDRALDAEDTKERIQQLTENPSLKVGFLLAAGGSVWTGYLSNVKRSDKYPVHKIMTLGVSQVYAGQIANRLGRFSYIATDATSCISGHSAWFNAKNMIDLGIIDAAVVVSVDNGTSEEYLDVFGEHNLAKLAHQEIDDVQKFRLGQGCHIGIFEGAKSLDTTKNIPIADIRHMEVCAEQHTNALGISPSGEGYTAVLTPLGKTDPTFIKTHSTFSEDNQVESQVITELFGNIDQINYKLRIGHTMGVSTAIESGLAIKEQKGTFISLGAGMGNVFSSALIDIL